MWVGLQSDNAVRATTTVGLKSDPQECAKSLTRFVAFERCAHIGYNFFARMVIGSLGAGIGSM